MTLICDFCKKPIEEGNDPFEWGNRKLDFHKECKTKFFDSVMAMGFRAAQPTPPPKGVERAVAKAEGSLKPAPPQKVKTSFWTGKPKQPKVVQHEPTEEDLVGAFGP